MFIVCNHQRGLGSSLGELDQNVDVLDGLEALLPNLEFRCCCDNFEASLDVHVERIIILNIDSVSTGLDVVTRSAIFLQALEIRCRNLQCECKMVVEIVR